ncbi:hypothetical protein PG997_012857 [Apiospora hydei]|uniref:Uncharacterized protein n=1 Tax=Apiospora hydei TaxID=1337664 RepID=A0ABR1V779_9PEZI
MLMCGGFFDSRPLTDASQMGLGKDELMYSREHILLHELMHLYNNGYYTGYDYKGKYDPLNDIQSTSRTKWANSKSPSPEFATLANADNYAWLGTAKYLQKFQSTTSRTRDGPSPGPDVGTSLNYLGFGDTDEVANTPDDACRALGQPATEDCYLVAPANDTSPVLLQQMACTTAPGGGGGGGSNTNTRRWCDLYTSYSCQVSIACDLAAGPTPQLTNADVARLFYANLRDPTQATCNPVAAAQTAAPPPDCAGFPANCPYGGSCGFPGDGRGCPSGDCAFPNRPAAATPARARPIRLRSS